jgi:hypothetical protein
MRFHPEYTWLESYLDNDAFWLEDVLNWDDTFELLLADYNIYHFVTSAFFVNAHFFLDSITKVSFLDTLFSVESNSATSSRELFDLLMWDHLSAISTNFFFSQFLFYTDYQDFFVVVLHHSPELMMAVEDFLNSYWLNAAMDCLPSAVFDVYSDSLNSNLFEFLDYGMLLAVCSGLFPLFLEVLRVTRWDNVLDSYVNLLSAEAYNWSRETRTHLEVAFQALFFIAGYWTMMIMTFDDDQEEQLEFFNGMWFNFYLFLLVYLMIKMTVHYLSYLEAAVSEGRTLLYITAQFRRDVISHGALVIRTMSLLIRLNIYDYNDDTTDSYYIYIGDFDEDEYFSELTFSVFTTMFFDTDNHDDRSFFLEDEADFSFDLFVLYFYAWGKFTSFFFLGIDEAARVSVGFGVLYTVLYEIHAVNKTYVEDTYLFRKRWNQHSNEKTALAYPWRNMF